MLKSISTLITAAIISAIAGDATLTFNSNWENQQSGDIKVGQPIHIKYDLARKGCDHFEYDYLLYEQKLQLPSYDYY